MRGAAPLGPGRAGRLGHSVACSHCSGGRLRVTYRLYCHGLCSTITALPAAHRLIIQSSRPTAGRHSGAYIPELHFIYNTYCSDTETSLQESANVEIIVFISHIFNHLCALLQFLPYQLPLFSFLCITVS